MTVHVFAGPTIPAARVREIVPEASVHHPVQHGDLLRLDCRPGDTVLILDGLFFQAPAVRHKEILHLLSSGVRVAGAASMGALRAAELHRYGMTGLGQVFRWYADGTVTADDEVAVAHLADEDGHRQLSDALVAIRYGLGHAAAEVITTAEADGLLALARGLPFPERSWARLWQLAGRGALAPAAGRVRDHLAAHPGVADVKRLDAELALRWVHDSSPATAPAAPEPPATVYLAEWRWENAEAPEQGHSVADALAYGFLQLFLPAYPQLHRQAVLAAIGSEAAGDRAVDRALSAARARGIVGADTVPTSGLQSWLTPAERAGETHCEQVARALVRSYRVEPGVGTCYTMPAGIAARPNLLRLARSAVVLAQSLNAAAQRHDPGFRIEYVRDDLVDQQFRDRWQCADLLTACWDRGLTGLPRLRELGRHFLLLARSGRIPEQALRRLGPDPAVARGTEARS